jgi:AcrR family transcriptional regulator
VSPSTFFRYFPTKEDVALYDALDPLFIEAFQAQPTELSPLAAMRAALHEVFRADSPEVAGQTVRAGLIMNVPELRMRMLDSFVETIDLFSGIVAERAGRPADDFAARTLVGAVVGVAISTWLDARGDIGPGFIEGIDRALDLLESGFRV